MSVYQDIVSVKSGSKAASSNVMFSVVSLGFSLVLFFIFIFPEYKEMKLIETERNLENTSLQDKKNTQDKLDKFEKDAATISDDNERKISMFFPEKNMIDYYLASIHNLSMKTLNLEKITISDKIEKNVNQGENAEKKGLILNGKELKKNKITLIVSGNYKNIILFEKSLEESIPLIELNSIKIKENNSNEKNEASNEEKALEAEVSFTIYYL